MIFATTLLAAIILMTVAFVLKVGALSFGAALLWVVFAIHCYGLSAHPGGGAWDIYYALYFLGFGMVLLCAFMPALMKPKKADVKEDIFLDEFDQQEKDWNDLQRGTRIPRMGRYRKKMNSKAVKSKWRDEPGV